MASVSRDSVLLRRLMTSMLRRQSFNQSVTTNTTKTRVLLRAGLTHLLYLYVVSQQHNTTQVISNQLNATQRNPAQLNSTRLNTTPLSTNPLNIGSHSLHQSLCIIISSIFYNKIYIPSTNRFSLLWSARVPSLPLCPSPSPSLSLSPSHSPFTAPSVV